MQLSDCCVVLCCVDCYKHLPPNRKSRIGGHLTATRKRNDHLEHTPFDPSLNRSVPWTDTRSGRYTRNVYGALDPTPASNATTFSVGERYRMVDRLAGSLDIRELPIAVSFGLEADWFETVGSLGLSPSRVDGLDCQSFLELP